MDTKIGKTVLVLLPAVLFCLMPVPSARADWGEHHGKEWEEKMDKKWEKMTEDLGLSEEQLEQIDSHRESKKETGQKLREDIRAKKKELRNELDAAETDKDRVDGLISEIGALMTEKLRNRTEAVLELKEILTSEQFEKLHEKKEKMREERKKEGWGKGYRHGPETESDS